MESQRKFSSQWVELVSLWKESGLTQQAYCKQKDINYHSFGYWKQKLAGNKGVRENKRKTGSFLKAKIEPPACLIVLELPNQIRIHLQAQDDRLAQIIKVAVEL